MKYIQNKWLLYIVTFFLVTVIGTVLSAMKPGDKVPDVSNAILIVGAIYGVIYLIIKFFKRFKNGEIKKENGGRIKANKNKGLLILLGLLLLTGWFYWFQYRPTKIRSYCHDQASEIRTLYDRYVQEKSFFSEMSTNKYKFLYDTCIHEKGLK